MFSHRLAPPGPENKLTRRRNELTAAGISLCNLAESNPSRCGLVPDALLDLLRNPEALNYNPDCQGLPSSRAALAEIHNTSIDDIFLTSSTSEAYSWLFKLLCDPGDSVLVPKPGYPLFDYLGGLEAVRMEPYRLEYLHSVGWRIDLDELKDRMGRLKPRALILIHPNNPTGSYISDTERATIEDLACTHQCALIVDEVFLPFSVEATTEPYSFRNSNRGLVFCLNGLSKMLCLPQIKLGWIELAGDVALRKDARLRLEVIADSYLSVGIVPMLALPALLRLSADVKFEVTRRLRVNLAVLHQIFDGPESPYRVLRCDGGWTALLESPRYLPEEELCLHLLNEARLILYPGYFFDCERQGIFAVSLILREEDFFQGVVRLKATLDSLATGC